MSLNTVQSIAFISCTEVDPDQNLAQNLTRVNVRSMTMMPTPYSLLPAKPDMVVFDQTFQVVFVACVAGIAVFDTRNGARVHVGTYILGKTTHTIAINDATREIYLPLPESGGRPTLRIVKYDPNGR